MKPQTRAEVYSGVVGECFRLQNLVDGKSKFVSRGTLWKLIQHTESSIANLLDKMHGLTPRDKAGILVLLGELDYPLRRLARVCGEGSFFGSLIPVKTKTIKKILEENKAELKRGLEHV